MLMQTCCTVSYCNVLSQCCLFIIHLSVFTDCYFYCLALTYCHFSHNAHNVTISSVKTFLLYHAMTSSVSQDFWHSCSLASGHLPNVSRVTPPPPFPSLPFLPPISNINHGILFRVCVRETFLQYCTKCVNVHLFVLYSAGQLNYYYFLLLLSYRYRCCCFCVMIDISISLVLQQNI